MNTRTSSIAPFTAPQPSSRFRLATLATGIADRFAVTRSRGCAHDLVAGLVLTSVLVPSSIAYAAASGVPGVYGLYASIVPLLVYALFGPNRVLVMGPDSALAALILR